MRRGFLASFRKWREEREQNRALESVIDDMLRRPSLRDIRKWKTEVLHAKLVGNELWKNEASMAQSELRRREAWNTPARWSLIVSALAFGFSLYAAFKPY